MDPPRPGARGLRPATILAVPRSRTDPRIEQARRAVALVFALNGLTFASWISRAPAIRDALGLSSGGLGALLMCAAVGSLIALPLSGAVVERIGPGRAVRGAAALTAVGLTVAAAGIGAAAFVLTGTGLLLAGAASSTWDVAMNVEGADVERRLGRTLLPRFHAAFSLGTVLGAALGAACAAAGVGVGVQLAATAVVAVTGAWMGVRRFVEVSGTQAPDAPRASVLAAWRERRTLLLGLMVVCFALGEGIANDWLAVTVVDGYGGSDALGALAFGTFVAAMTLGRLVGGSFLERHGRPAVLRCLAGLVVAGVLLVVIGPGVGAAFAGAVLWGLGASLGFPVGISAAADEERMATVRVSVVSSIGYTAFLAGPPLIGLLADMVGIRGALLVTVGAMAVALTVLGAARPTAVAAA